MGREVDGWAGVSVGRNECIRSLYLDGSAIGERAVGPESTVAVAVRHAIAMGAPPRRAAALGGNFGLSGDAVGWIGRALSSI